MIIDINNLPTDTNILQQIVTDLVGELVSLTDTNLSLKEQLANLQAQLALLRKRQFGQSSERGLVEQHPKVSFYFFIPINPCVLEHYIN